MAANTLLIELGVEELPPGAIDALADALAEGIRRGLTEAEIAFGAVRAYATPRRLAVQVAELADKQPDREIERRGPALAAAYKDGQPTKAAEGFARSCGVEVNDLIHLETDKGTWLGYREQQQERPPPACCRPSSTRPSPPCRYRRTCAGAPHASNSPAPCIGW